MFPGSRRVHSPSWVLPYICTIYTYNISYDAGIRSRVAASNELHTSLKVFLEKRRIRALIRTTKQLLLHLLGIAKIIVTASSQMCLNHCYCIYPALRKQNVGNCIFPSFHVQLLLHLSGFALQLLLHHLPALPNTIVITYYQLFFV